MDPCVQWAKQTKFCSNTNNFILGRTILPPAGLAEFVATALRVFPHLRDIVILRAWGGIEGYTPDHLPVIGRGSQPGVIHGFGFSAHGFQLGPAVGEALADLVMARQPRVNLDAFAPGRFTSQPEKDLF